MPNIASPPNCKKKKHIHLIHEKINSSHNVVKGTLKKQVISWINTSDNEEEGNVPKKKRPLGIVANGSENSHPTGPSKYPHANGRTQKDGGATGIQALRKHLPIAAGKEALIEEIRKNDVVVLLGETGSGKTTQVPQYILESQLMGVGMIAVTQPRRVAATSLALRVAAEKGTKIGKLIGYSVRFDECTSEETRIKYMTDGMMVRELLSDRLLSAYSVVVVDEAHERTLRTDLLVANLKRIQRERNQHINFAKDSRKGKGKGVEDGPGPLKIVIMSATIDAEKFSNFFGGAKILYVKGRQHPVKIYHASENQKDYLDSATRTFFQVHLDQSSGDILIFLPGQEDIESLEKSIEFFAKQLPAHEKEVRIYKMFASQAPGQNLKAFERTPPNTRKCILATNIAETSITIPGIKYVIDTGMCKEKRYLARNTGGDFDTLLTRPITKSSAIQRAGRAGREGPGVCFRLFTEAAYDEMALAPEPEIYRVSLTSSVLQLKCLGQDLEDLDLMDMPDQESIFSALKMLWLLGALDSNKKLTPLGREMALYPLDPAHARIIYASKEFGCTSEVLDIVSVLSASSKLFLDILDQREGTAEVRNTFVHGSGDHLTVLNVMRAYADLEAGNVTKGTRRDWCKKYFLNECTLLEAGKIKAQLQRVCERMKFDWKTSCGEYVEGVIKSLALGLVQNSAFLQPDGSYKQTLGPSIVKIHPGSVLSDKRVPAIIYDELVLTSHMYCRGVTSVPKSVIASIGAFNRRSVG